MDNKSEQDEIEELKAIHYKMRSYLDVKNYKMARKYMQEISNTHNVNKIKTLLILTTSFVNYPDLKEVRYKMYQRFNAALGQVHQEFPMFKIKDKNVPGDKKLNQ